VELEDETNYSVATFIFGSASNILCIIQTQGGLQVYKITNNNNILGYSDTIAYIRLHSNGSYVSCNKNTADGFCVKLFTEYVDEESNKIQTVQDTVFCFPEHTMRGTEPVAEVEHTVGQIEIANRDALIDELIVEVLEGGLADV
jgi:hypothetical protein